MSIKNYKIKFVKLNLRALTLLVTILCFILSNCQAYNEPDNSLKPVESISGIDIIMVRVLSNYKSILSESLSISNDIENNLINCNLKIKEKSLLHQNNYSPENQENPGKEILSCMSSFLNLRFKIEKNRNFNTQIQSQLNSGLYNNVTLFKTKLLSKLNELSKSNNEFMIFSDKMIDEYGKQHLSFVKGEFAQAISSGSISGEIKGTCVHLKSAYEKQELLFEIKKVKNPFIYFSQFLNKVKGYELVSNAIRDSCPVDFKPPDYKPLVVKVSEYVKTLPTNDLMTSACSKPLTKNYLIKECEKASTGDLVIGPYLISILSKLEEVSK